MKEIKGLSQAFKNTKVVLLTTFTEEGDEISRQMTNYNEDPYQTIWFPTFKKTRKIQHIKENPRVLITLPTSEENQFYIIEGLAELANDEEVEKKWKWWLLYWHRDQEFWYRLTSDAPFTNRAIINIKPTSAKKTTIYPKK